MAGFFARALTGLIVLYGLACLAAVAIMVVGVTGIVGEPDGLAAVYAILLSAPWGLLLLKLLPEGPPLVAAGVLVAGMAINLILLGLIRWWAMRKAAAAR